MDGQPNHENNSGTVNETLRSGETYGYLSTMVMKMDLKSRGVNDEGQKFARIVLDSDAEDAQSLLRKQDPRWKAIMDGVRTVMHISSLAQSAEKDKKVYTNAPSGHTSLVDATTDFFGNSVPEYGGFSDIEEANRLNTLSPTDIVSETERIIQRSIALTLAEKEKPANTPLEEMDAQLAKTGHAEWVLLHEGFKLGLTALGISLDSNGKAVPGSAKFSEDQQIQAIGLLDEQLPVIMKRTYGYENFPDYDADYED